MWPRNHIDCFNFRILIKKFYHIIQFLLLRYDKRYFNILNLWVFYLNFIDYTLNPLVIMTHIEYYFLRSPLYPLESTRLGHSFDEVAIIKWNIFFFANHSHDFIYNCVIYMLVSDLVGNHYELRILGPRVVQNWLLVGACWADDARDS